MHIVVGDNINFQLRYTIKLDVRSDNLKVHMNHVFFFSLAIQSFLTAILLISHHYHVQPREARGVK